MSDPFHIEHAEKIAWMIETEGFAVEPVAPRPEADPPMGGYTYTIGFPEHTGWVDVAVFGLTPVAARGLIGMVAGVLRGGTEIPIGVELVGLLDNELRCCFLTIDVVAYRELFSTAETWYQGSSFSMVQFVYPDRNGFLPYETGFDQRLRFAQPVLGEVAGLV